jgi:TldD protein
MIDDLPFDKLVQTAIRHGADFAEVFAERTRTTTILCDDRRLECIATYTDCGVGIRAIKEDRTSYGSTTDLSRRALLSLAREVGRMTCAARVRAPLVFFAEQPGKSVTTVRQHPVGIPLEDKCDVVSRGSDIAWKTGPEIRQVRIAYRDVVRRIWIATSDGLLAVDEQIGTTLTTHVVAGNEAGLQTGLENVGGAIGFEIFDETPPEEIAERAARRAIRMLSARAAPAGSMAVIVGSEAGGTMIHEAVGHGLEADLAGEGLSVYAGRLGEKVASELITVVDDATLPGRRGSFTFDDEGTPSQRTVLIEQGVLKTYLTDRKMAAKLCIPASGNARRQGYEQLPIVRMTNTFVTPGREPPAAILRDTPSGLYVKRLGGGQVSTVNGDFVFDVQEGYLIEGGKIGEPVRGASLIGNGPKVLASIDRVGSDLGFSIGICGKEGQEAPVSCGQPTLRIPQLVVGGTA